MKSVPSEGNALSLLIPQESKQNSQKNRAVEKPPPCYACKAYEMNYLEPEGLRTAPEERAGTLAPGPDITGVWAGRVLADGIRGFDTLGKGVRVFTGGGDR